MYRDTQVSVSIKCKNMYNNKILLIIVVIDDEQSKLNINNKYENNLRHNNC